MARLRFAARDPGGANVLAALVSTVTDGSAALDAWTLPRASALRAALPSASRVFDDPPTALVLEQAWDELPASVLVTGTSHYAPFEQTLWRIASERGIPSLAVLDQWMNVAARFSHGRPDFVAVLDEVQGEDVVRLGFSRDRVVAMGHPWLSRLARASSARRPADRGGVRVLLVSEPIRNDVLQGVNAPFGFDEFDVFNVVHAAAADVASAAHPVTLAVKCHPYEDVAAFEHYIQGLPPVPYLKTRCLPADAVPLDEAAASDVVIGISSMLLMEAMVLGCAVVSVQPNLIREDTFIPSAQGATRTLTDADEGRRVVGELILSDAARDSERRRHARFTDTVAGDSGAAFTAWLDRVAPGVLHGRP